MRSRSVAVAVVVLAVTACAEPELPEGNNSVEGAEQPLEAEQLDPTMDALMVEVATLTAAVTAARGHLEDAVDADDVTSARVAGRAAAGQLVDDPELAGAATGTPPLFPGETADRAASADAGDAFSATLFAARDTSDPLGRAVVDSLQDPIAGDLGAWQRDAAGVLRMVRDTAVAGAELEQLEAAVLELPGEGTRALAWALVVADAPTVEDAGAYAERGIAHLEIVLAALDALETPAPEPDGSDT